MLVWFDACPAVNPDTDGMCESFDGPGQERGEIVVGPIYWPREETP